MAFTSAQLSNRISQRIESKFGKLPKPAREAVKKFADALAEGIVQFLHDDTNIKVTIDAPGAITGTGEFE